MREYLKRVPNGYQTCKGLPPANLGAVALTADGRCVFGSRSKPSDANVPSTPLTKAQLVQAQINKNVREKLEQETAAQTTICPDSQFIDYDDEVERQRRLVCDTALAQLVLDHPELVLPAVRLVNDGIKKYWNQLQTRLTQPTSYEYEEDGTDTTGKKIKVKKTGQMPLGSHVVNKDGKWVSNPTSFGRLDRPASGLSEVATVNSWLTAFSGNDLPKMMTLHDTFLKVYRSDQDKKTGSAGKQADQFNLREKWFDDKDLRGREDRDKKSYTATNLPGVISNDFTIPWGQALLRSGIDPDSMRVEKRNRGTDMFRINATLMNPKFKEVLGNSNLIFAASASGTTGTQLASAYTFAPVVKSDAELKRQYLLACVGYLVGGGMHTCHEAFYTGNLAGLPYTTGKYLDMLPKSFITSRQYEKWVTEFWDVVRSDRVSPR